MTSMRSAFLCAVVAAFFSFVAPAAAQIQLTISTPILASAPNFRDIAGLPVSAGGTGLVNPTSNFGLMRPGVFYRSSALTLSSPDLATVTSLGIGRDIDLRTPAEIAAAPDVVPTGTIYTNVNIFGLPGPPPITALITSQASVLNAGQSGYRTFVTDPTMRAGFGTVLVTLAHDPGPDLFHCSDGKDRTGWTAVLLDSIAGVSPATIMTDYLASNTYLAKPISSQAAGILAVSPGLSGLNFNQIFGVDPSYLQAALNQVNASYGSMYGYLTQGLGLTQADIYVLRAKMVYYPVLPGQTAFAGNAGAGAGLLNALQNSPLSGNYTAYNYYLQSSVDTGTLGGVQGQVGGQVHADAASYLLRQPQRIDEALAPYTDGRDLGSGQAKAWLAGLGGSNWTDGRDGAASSTEYSAGSVAGATWRINDQASANAGLGYNWGSVASAGGSVNINTVLARLGGRYGFSSLDSGPFVQARAGGGWVDYQSSRSLGAGLGTATGNANGADYGGRADLGDVFRLAPLTLALQAGIGVNGETLGGFQESGSELALNVHGASNVSSSLLVDLDVSLDQQRLGAWTVAPDLTLGYQRVLGNPQVTSLGTLYGLAVSQTSAYDSRDLWKAGLGFTVQRNAFSLKARGNVLVGDGAKSVGLGGQLSIAYNF
jgi:protein tyrosine/serine phosphatase